MEMWTQLPAWLRYSVSIGLVGIAVCILMFAERIPLYTVGMLFGLGVAAFFIGPSDSDDNGYKF